MTVEMRFPIILKKIIVLPLFLCIFFTACEEEEEDYSISEITIYNIPAQIPVYNGLNPPTASNPTFKVYLNASDSKGADDIPVAKGLAKISGEPENGTYTVTMRLQKANRVNGMNPNLPTDPWSGTASFFLIVLSPETVSSNISTGVKMIWAKTGFTLDIGKENCNWKDNKIFIDFRNPILSEGMGLAAKTIDLFEGIILQDDDIHKEP